MGSNLSKTPLLAVIHAALITFFLAPMPFSAGFREAMGAFSIPVSGYLLLFVYGLFLSVLLGVLFYNAQTSGIRFFLSVAVSSLGIICLQPLLEQIAGGQPTGVMTVGDSWLVFAAAAVSLVLLLVLGGLLFQRGGEDQGKYLSKKLPLLIKIVVSPFVFMVLYFITWYYAAWRTEAVRVYYLGAEAAADAGFVAELINLLLTNAGVVTFALLQGLLYVLLSLPLLLQLPGKRLLFVVCNTLFYLTGALCWLIPSAVVPDTVRWAQLIRSLILLLLYGVFTSIMLHTSLQRERTAAPTPEPVPAKGAPSKAAPTAVRR